MSFFIMVFMVFKNLLRKPVTLRYPFVPRVYPEHARGKLTIDQPQCIYCGMCQRKCPSRAITVSRQDKTWTIDRMRCIVCNNCVETCPKKCLKMENAYSHAVAIKPRGLFQDA